MSMTRLIIGGILAIPCLLVTVCVAPLLALLAIPPLLVLLLRKAPSGLSSKHPPDQVIIAGGSSGIGLCLAKECVQRGVPKITILARDPTKLQAAKQELEALKKKKKKANATTTKIQTISVSVSDLEPLKQAAAICFEESSSNCSSGGGSSGSNQNSPASTSPRVALFNCAGIPYTTEFHKIPADEFLKLVQTNQLGSMYLVQAFLPYLDKGVICLTSSVAGQAGVYGYSAYTPTKAAIVGFANCLVHELLTTKPNLHVQVAFPADTQTPGYQEEIKMMPAITKALNETSGLANPLETAKAMADAAFQPHPKFGVYFNIDGWALTNLTAGFGPVSNMGDALAQISLLNLFRWIALFVQNDFWRIIRSFDGKEELDNGINEGNNNEKNGSEGKHTKGD
ncbi:unnamed protein product [Cylindrotheca closterium]|uniref:3-ketodihydrosphingosine reductase n=1 Tax=Cylindrotheca closterium TaxID=2856 RepID=A0AAD2JP67_9STRA|nr:unnamed protein product [Cylindrotheca closterium]